MNNKALPHIELTPQQTLYLMLDGNVIDDLPRLLYTVDNGAEMLGLYQGTALEKLLNVSPWLVELDMSRSNPILEWVIEHDYFARSAAWLLSSEQNLHQVAKHFQSLWQVAHPLGHQVVLRLQDPRVAKALLSSHIAQGIQRLSGPICCCWFYEQGEWATLQVAKLSNDRSPYTLSDEDLKILDEVTLQHLAKELVLHIKEYFPKWPNINAELVIQQAQQRGFTTKKGIRYYTNVLGYCYYGSMKKSKQELIKHPKFQEIHRLVNKPSLLTPEQRVRQAAKLAYHYAQGATHV